MGDNIWDFTKISIWVVAKWFVVAALVIYLVFALVIVRQVYMMTRVVSGELDLAVKVAAWVYFVLSLLVFFLALVVL